MKHFLLITLLLPLFALSAQTQDDLLSEVILPEGMTQNIDTLLLQWHAQKLLHYPTDCEQTSTNPVFPDEVYAERLSLLPTIIPMPYNAAVRKCIDGYLERGRRQVSFLLGAANFYIPLFEETLDRYGLPLELKYLPIVESALNPSAVSRAGAAGLWQFMLATGKQYGLESNSLIDDRRDPLKSTESAARYLQELHRIFGDWTLALAAYNCGPGNVSKAIRRAGGVNDFWVIYPFLPQETRGYVPAFIAANYVMNYYCEHGICPLEADFSFRSDTVMVGRKLHLGQIAAVTDTKIEVLRALNPQYKVDIIPSGGYALRLPLDKVGIFIDSGDSVYNYQQEVYNPIITTVAISETATTTPTPTSAARTTTHTVRRGDTLGGIAKRYGVTVSQLRSWNGLRNNNLQVGKRLRVRR